MTPTPRIVLASQSPRRAQLLELIGLSYEVLPADLDETYRDGESPPEHARRLAGEKALAIARVRPEALVVGSDTVVVIDGEVLGKPRDEVHALEMLMRLQGREHEVQTGIAVAAPAALGSGREAAAPGAAGGAAETGVRVVAGAGSSGNTGVRVVADVETVRVRFRRFDEATAREYVETGEPMDKAGAYGIQGFGATIVECIEGDYFAVMGLPIGRMVELFRRLGWRYNFRGLEAL